MRRIFAENRIGYACTPISLGYRTSRSFVLKNFNEDNFKLCVKQNLEDLMNILKWNVEHDIYLFRISSDIIPFGSHPINQLAWWEWFESELKQCGVFAKQHNIRVSMHPGQYTVINSPNEEVLRNSIKDLAYHCRFLDSLEVDSTNKIILHVGGVYGDKREAMERFKDSYNKLSDSIKRRLVIENDDRNYTIEDILELSKELGIPAVFDNLHHQLNPCSLVLEEIIQNVKATWKTQDGRVKVHYSDQDMDKKKGAHSNSVNTKNFMNYIDSMRELNPDIMLEVKDKELSAVKCICVLKEQIAPSKRTELWAKYKYSIMEKNYSYYKTCSSLINSDASMGEIFLYMDACLEKPFEEGSFKNAAEHVYGYVKKEVTPKEKLTFQELLTDVYPNQAKIKSLLKKLCKKYNAEYINQSYYFII